VLPASYRRVTVATLRWKVYRLAGKLVRHARGCMLQIKADLEKWRLLQSASGLLRGAAHLRQGAKKAWLWNYRAAVSAGGVKKLCGGPMGPEFCPN